MAEDDKKTKAPQGQQLGESPTPTIIPNDQKSKSPQGQQLGESETPTNIPILEIISKWLENNKAPQEQHFGKSATPTIPRMFNWDSNYQTFGPKELKVGPALVGLTVEEATKKIKEEVGEDVKIIVIPPGHGCTQELSLSLDRVKLIVDSSGIVVITPVLS